MNKKFTWVSSFMKIANKLLEYKNNRKELVNIMYEILEELNLFNENNTSNCNLDKFNGKRCRYTDFDPFSFMNRLALYKHENRIAFIKKFEEKTKMEIDLPEDFDGVPSVNPNLSCMLRFKDERAENDIDDLWELFETAILYANKQTKELENKFIKYYDIAIQKPNCLYNISACLFRLNPNFYVNLDTVNRKYIKEKININIIKCPNGKEYLELIEKIKTFINNSSEFQNICDFSEKAFKAFSNIKEMAETHDLEESQNINYYWLNANPNIWKFSDIKINESIDYTTFNENGNKRKIYKYFKKVKKGDKIIGYETTPTKKIVSLCEIEKPLKNNKITIKKIKDLKKPIPFNEFKDLDGLQDMEFLHNNQGSLFKLTENQYHILYNLILTENNYDKKEFLKEAYITESEYEEIISVLKRKQNIILEGAPGIGKTFLAKRLVYSLLGRKNDDQIMTIQFHQSYSYEEFIEGFRPTKEGSFKLEKGIFYNFCKKAQNNPDNNYYLIIDEINRGNLSKIFGELLMLIENDKRGETLTLAYSKELFSVPKNIYIIGLMNTADRSLAIMDYALRRRFSFVELNPAFDNDNFKNYLNNLNNNYLRLIINKIKNLNNEIANDPALGNGFRIGHSYFCNLNNISEKEIKLILKYDIIPMLKEYWYDDNEKVNYWSNLLLEDYHE